MSESDSGRAQLVTANSTWETQVLPKHANFVSTKWVFTGKTDIDGNVERFKARLVARGFSQILGEGYTETFAPAVRISADFDKVLSIRLLINHR